MAIEDRAETGTTEKPLDISKGIFIECAPVVDADEIKRIEALTPTKEWVFDYPNKDGLLPIDINPIETLLGRGLTIQEKKRLTKSYIKNNGAIDIGYVFTNHFATIGL